MIRDLTKILNRKYIYMSADTGRFVSRTYALLHPKECFATPRHGAIEPMERL